MAMLKHDYEELKTHACDNCGNVHLPPNYSLSGEKEPLLVRRVRIAAGLLESIALGYRIEWGEPDSEGFYEPRFIQ